MYEKKCEYKNEKQMRNKKKFIEGIHEIQSKNGNNFAVIINSNFVMIEEKLTNRKIKSKEVKKKENTKKRAQIKQKERKR